MIRAGILIILERAWLADGTRGTERGLTSRILCEPFGSKCPILQGTSEDPLMRDPTVLSLPKGFPLEF